MNRTVCVLGDGAWATALAMLLADNGYTVNLWCPDEHQAALLAASRCNDRYMPGVVLPDSIKPMADIAAALAGTNWVVEAIPVKYMRAVLLKAREHISPDQKILITSKGIEKDTQLLPAQVVADVLGANFISAVLSGPSFARQVINKAPTAVVIACPDVSIAQEAAKMVRNNYFCASLGSDMVGVQVGAALKNVVALGMGLLDGAGYPDNTQAFFLAQGLQEMAVLSSALGGVPATIYGLSGVGDLVLTAFGSASRNREVGFRLGRGQSLAAIIDATGYTPEGINTVESVHLIARRHSLDLPLCTGLYEHIFNGRSLPDVLAGLMQN